MRSLCAFVLAASTVPAMADDLAVIVMQSESGERGFRSTPMAQERCDDLLALAAKQRQAGLDFWLTVPDPEFRGLVLEVACIGPDGVVRKNLR